MIRILLCACDVFIPSKQRPAISGSSQSCNPTENAAKNGVHAILNIGRTCSKCLADANGDLICDTDSIRFLAALDITSISIFHKSFRFFSLAIICLPGLLLVFFILISWPAISS